MPTPPDAPYKAKQRALEGELRLQRRTFKVDHAKLVPAATALVRAAIAARGTPAEPHLRQKLRSTIAMMYPHQRSEFLRLAQSKSGEDWGAALEAVEKTVGS